MQHKPIEIERITGKPRVYFCCHEADFEKYFENVTDEILAIQSCGIFYDSEPVHIDEDRALELGEMQLFVMPVTAKLLTTGNVALDEEFRFAMEHHIPVLPLMQQPGLSELFKIKCGDLQYLEKYSNDPTAISYEDKLKKYITSVLVGDEMAEKIRNEFAASIFLSYRKVDRKYANRLMHSIHSNGFARDVAIWYDEFLVPGESFNDAILDRIDKSGLFSLVVTQNLNEEGNYVMTKEYIRARDAEKPVFPAAYKLENSGASEEAVATDMVALHRNFDGIPECVDGSDEAAVSEALHEKLCDIIGDSNNDEPMHKYLIGLAYLHGVDVEVNHELAVKLITEAAEAELPEAMETLRNMYWDGTGVELDYNEACKWGQRLADCYIAKKGEEDPDTLDVLNKLAIAYGSLGQYQHAQELSEKIYELRCRLLGVEDTNTLISLCNLATGYHNLGQYKKSLELSEKAYNMFCKVLGEEHQHTLTSLRHLAVSYIYLGQYDEAMELSKKSYYLFCKVCGETYSDTLMALEDMAEIYGHLGKYKKSLELHEKAYNLRCKVLGEEHPHTLNSLNNLAATYKELGQYKKGLEMDEKAYNLRCKVLGEEHPDTLNSLSNLALSYSKNKLYKKALELSEKVYNLRCKLLGEEHPLTLTSLGNLALSYFDLGKINKSLQLSEKAYNLRCRVLGEKHPDTLNSLYNLGINYSELGKQQKATETIEKAYRQYSEKFGENHPNTIKAKQVWLALISGSGKYLTHGKGKSAGKHKKRKK